LRNGDAVVAEIERTSALIGLLAHPSRLFRLYGKRRVLDRRIVHSRVAAFLCEHGYRCVAWNAVPPDQTDPDGVVERALGQIEARDETLLVLHDLTTSAMARLAGFIGRVRESGARSGQNFCRNVRRSGSGRWPASVRPP
jgi:hypothetical protein